MVDTQRFQLGPHCVAMVSGVTSALVRDGEHGQTHAFQITSHLPLDVDSVARILDSLEGEERVARVQRGDELSYFEVDDDFDAVIDIDDLEYGDHLDEAPGFMRNLSALRDDPEWVRRVRDQHELIHIAAGARTATIDLGYFTSRTEIPSARIQSLLNDFAAEGYISVEVDEDEDSLRYRLPEISYPDDRYSRNMEILRKVEQKPSRSQRYWLAAVVVAVIILTIVILRRLSLI